MKRAIQTTILFYNCKRPRETSSASSSATDSEATPELLTVSSVNISPAPPLTPPEWKHSLSAQQSERNFSLMNNISSDKRAVLLISNISNLMMININGPPTSMFDPQKYTRTWLKRHRAASSMRSRQCSVKTPTESKSVWNILWALI